MMEDTFVAQVGGRAHGRCGWGAGHMGGAVGGRARGRCGWGAGHMGGADGGGARKKEGRLCVGSVGGSVDRKSVV